MRISKPFLYGALFSFCGVLGATGMLAYRSGQFRSGIKNLVQRSTLTKQKIAQALSGSAGQFHQFPSEIELNSDSEKVRAKVQYTFDSQLQASMEELFRSYTPDYGAFVALDATTGRVLSMVSYSRHGKLQDNLALRATFPSASVFKVVTAAAAIENKKVSAETLIPYNGRNHTLYRSNILKTKVTRWTRYITVKDAFARSINTVFGKIGAYDVGAQNLRHYADRFGFDRQIASDMPVQEGHAAIPLDPSDAWGLAETASGFTPDNTMSPLQGALIAAAIVNDGTMMEPFVVDTIQNTSDRIFLYHSEPKIGTLTVDSSTAAEIRNLMRETVTHGTSHKSFKGFFKGVNSELDVGGKTGSLTGKDPRGKYDWFVGFAQDKGGRDHRIAFAALTIHEKLWRVKSSYLVRRAIENYFKELRVQSARPPGSNPPALRTRPSSRNNQVALSSGTDISSNQ